LSDATYQGLLQNLVSSFALQVDRALRTTTLDFSTFDSFDFSLQLVSVVVSGSSRPSHSKGASARLLPEVFVLAYLLPRCSDTEDNASVLAARDIWTKWVTDDPSDLRSRVLQTIKDMLKAFLADTGVRIRCVLALAVNLI
jgi:hypothetical protein